MVYADTKNVKSRVRNLKCVTYAQPIFTHSSSHNLKQIAYRWQTPASGRFHLLIIGTERVIVFIALSTNTMKTNKNIGQQHFWIITDWESFCRLELDAWSVRGLINDLLKWWNKKQRDNTAETITNILYSTFNSVWMKATSCIDKQVFMVNNLTSHNTKQGATKRKRWRVLLKDLKMINVNGQNTEKQ